MIRIRAPGRICLFGEHQDYLGYPVIALAIDRYIFLEAKGINSPKFEIYLPDINDCLEIPLNGKEIEYITKRDYLRSGYNLFLRNGISFEKGYKVRITGNIPINAGVSSSSALVIAWLKFLNIISNNPFPSREDLALLGYQTEVEEFNEAGGMMDHFTSTFGNLIYLEPTSSPLKFISRNIKLDNFILGHSLEKKETIKDLMRVKELNLRTFKLIKEIMPSFNQFSSNLDEIQEFLPSLENKYQEKLIGNLLNRDLTRSAKKLLIDEFPVNLKHNSEIREKFYEQLGTLLTKHQDQLRETIKISTKKIDSMISACLNKGAYGAKINGSGFGGTMFALCPGNKKKSIAEAIENEGGQTYQILTSEGVEVY